MKAKIKTRRPKTLHGPVLRGGRQDGGACTDLARGEAGNPVVKAPTGGEPEHETESLDYPVTT